jgi:SSS family transporter
MNLVLLGVLGYIVVQLAIGVLVSRSIKTESDYLIGGRRLGLGLVTFSLFATWFGAETCIGAAGMFYDEGLAGGVSDPFGYALALFLVGWFFARPLWHRGLTTLADLFRARFGPATERFAALIMVPTSIFWAAAQIRAFGIVLHAATGLEVTVAVLIATGVVIAYTCTGGLLADVVTDFIQGLAIILGLGALLWSLANNANVDLAAAWRAVEPERFNLFGGEGGFWEKLDVWLTVILGSVVAQEIVARILGARSAAIGVRGAHLGGGLYLAVGLIPAFLGLVGPQLLPGLENSETFLPKLAETHLSPVLFVLFTGAIVSAILSTVDSTLLAASSLASHNLIVSFRPQMSDRQRLITARVGVAAFGLIACGFALGAETIFELVQQANGVGSAGIFVLMVGGLYAGKFGGARAGLATLAVGLGTWAWGTYIAEWTVTYLVSLACAAGTFVTVGWFEHRSRAA